MKWVLNILGVLLFLVGTVWILQGTGVYAVGMMANQMQYAYAGIVVDIVAIALFFIANRRRKHLPPSSSNPPSSNNTNTTS
jgi:formate hydrogenlyase subunit 3/multisubunit Na+/H+ antiporter MnhD subunit